MFSVGKLIIDPIINIALQTLPTDSAWYSMMESMSSIFPTLIDVCLILLIVIFVFGIVRSIFTSFR